MDDDAMAHALIDFRAKIERLRASVEETEELARRAATALIAAEAERDEWRARAEAYDEILYMPGCDMLAVPGARQPIYPPTPEKLGEIVAERDRLRAERDRLLAALTPNAETKRAYIGEFHFHAEIGVDENGDDAVARVMVPWTTVKDIMAAILTRAEGGKNG